MPQVHPVKGNVGFASAQSSWSFTLRSFAQLYSDISGVFVDIDKFMQRLWGDIYYNPETRKFTRKQEDDMQRSFVHFILEPLYKIYTQVSLPLHPCSHVQLFGAFIDILNTRCGVNSEVATGQGNDSPSLSVLRSL